MQVLLVGSGAREHALAWKFSTSPLLEKLWFWPGNGFLGASFGERLPVRPEAEFDTVARAALEMGIDLAVIGPENPLADGIADVLRRHRLPVFGPVQAAARLESSKAFAKDVMASAGIPTAAHQIAYKATEARTLAKALLKSHGAAVLKASGLAAGKGVFVCTKSEDVEEALTRLYSPAMLTAASELVIETRLEGRECSYFVFVGERGDYVPLGFAVDYKRLHNQDLGPNTGGMGCYTPVSWLPHDADAVVHEKILEPLLAELRRRDIAFTGCLYIGLMWGNHGPSVVEFNCRLGDPETQSLVVSDDADWLQWMYLLTQGSSNSQNSKLTIERHPYPTVSVVVSAPGYPFSQPEAGDHWQFSPDLLTHGRAAAEAVKVFAAGVRGSSSELTTGGGRVFTISARGAGLGNARDRVYAKVNEIHRAWEQGHFRSDIAE